MHEQDFKQALRDSMAVVTAPPPMNETVVLDAAKRAVRRRRAIWASGASAAAVVALAAGVAFAAPGTDRSGPRVGAEVTMTNPPPSSGTEPGGPDGQTDVTANSGPHYEQGVNLLNKLAEAVPPGYAAQHPDAPDLRTHQAWWDTAGGSRWWVYDATIPVVKDGLVGKLSVSVSTPGNDSLDAEGCELSNEYQSVQGSSCRVVSVSGTQVGVVSAPGPFEELAAYRHADGTVVVVSHRIDYPGAGYEPLHQPALFGEELAQLATDPRFHLD